MGVWFGMNMGVWFGGNMDAGFWSQVSELQFGTSKLLLLCTSLLIRSELTHAVDELFGTHRTFKARFWPWFSGRVFIFPLSARPHPKI